MANTQSTSTQLVSPSSYPALNTNQQKNVVKGSLLKEADKDIKMLNSGIHGAERLFINTVLDYQEKHPGISRETAAAMAVARLELTLGGGK